MSQTENIILFLQECEKLKSALRYAVTSSSRKESSAEHSRRLAVMVLLLWNEVWQNINVFHAVKIALFHDLAEAITGDIDSYEIFQNPDLKQVKQDNEQKAMKYFQDMLWWDLWAEVYAYREEYEAWATNESKFVKALDKLETLHQFTDAGENIFDQPEYIAHYADKHVANVPELHDVLIITKRKLKDAYEKWWWEWKEEYDISE